ARRLRRSLRPASPPDRLGRALPRALLQPRTDLPEARAERGRRQLLSTGAARGPAVRRGAAESGPCPDVDGAGRGSAILLAQSHPRETRARADVFRTGGDAVAVVRPPVADGSSDHSTRPAHSP